MVKLARIEYIHDANCVHRDLKPSNFLIGAQKDQSCIHIIDFGLANQYRDSISNEHIPLSRKTTITGTSRYMSIRSHLGVEHSRRDDLESLAYILIYFMQGSLPWQGLEAGSRNQKHQRIMRRKIRVPIGVLCTGLPDAFGIFLKYARDLPFEARPDYDYLRALFRDALHFAGYNVDDRAFDWGAKVETPSNAAPRVVSTYGCESEAMSSIGSCDSVSNFTGKLYYLIFK